MLLRQMKYFVSLVETKNFTEAAERNNGKASECIGCGKCERACPQHLPIRELLKDVADTFERA